ncbi:hypothetical protein [Rhodoferax sp. AJA081-3]|uniref:hypothetical protein n=1 Tax=Rhodoferax sp. AJA081-3 TaxID=2752316 RepID=UPI001AE09ACD|nr:hypothetical protein [Rhodoferax sp. AJA081-3]
MQSARSIAEDELRHWRRLEASEVLQVVAQHAKVDLSFHPRDSYKTVRWHASVDGIDYELLTDRCKFWDTRALKGGGGAIDMVMHLKNLDFKTAVQFLASSGL